MKTSARNNPYRLFANALREHWVAYTAGMLAMLITSLSEIMLPKFIQWAVEVATRKDDIPAFFQNVDKHAALDRLVIFFLLSLTLGWLGRVLWRQILARQSHISGHRIKSRLWDVLKDQPQTLLDRYSLGDLMNRATADWNRVRAIHGFTIVMTFDLIFFTVLATISMLMIHVPTALLCLAIVPFLPRPVIKISKQEYKLHDFAQEQLSLLSDLIAQAVGTIRLQRSTASEGIWNIRLRAYAGEYAKRQLEVLKVGWRIFILGAMPTLFAYLVLYTYGIYQIKAGTISIGAFLALQSYVLLLQGPLFELGSNISEWQTGFASYRRISEVYDLERTEEFHAPLLVDADAPAIVTRNLSLRFHPERAVLDKIDLLVKTGEIVGFMGPIGAGKSMLVNSVAGLVETFEGEIWIAGHPIDEASREWMTSMITMVPQKPFLFAGSIKHNLAPSRAETITDEELIEALTAVELWTDVSQFRDGLESWIGEWGINLSGGQKQRLAMARALLKPSSILILDDCLSAVDSVTEARILDNLAPYLAGRTVLWTAHRLSSLQACSRIYKMHSGRIHPFEKASAPSRAKEETHAAP